MTVAKWRDAQEPPDSPTSPRVDGLCRVFVSYARVDEPYRQRLGVHLAPLVREGLIELWSDRAIAPGAEWESDLDHVLDTADMGAAADVTFVWEAQSLP